MAIDSRQIKKNQALPVLGAIAGENLSIVLDKINAESDSPLRLAASSIPDAKLNFSSSLVVKGDGANSVSSPVDSLVFPSLSSPFINFQTQALSNAADFDISFPASTVGFFRHVGFALISSGKIKATFSAETATEGVLSNPGALFPSGTPIGYATLVCTNVAGYFKTAGSASNIIENAKIFRFGAGGSAPAASSSGVTNIIVETPAGLINDANVTYTLTYTPTTGKTAMVIKNGLIQYITTDFTISGATITFTTAPASASNILVLYVTDSKLVQKLTPNGDGATLKFKTDYATDAIVFVDGLFSEIGVECKVIGNLVEFFTAPALDASIYVIASGLGQFSQSALVGTVDGVNTVFTISNIPTISGAVIVVLNGRAIAQGAGVGKCVVSGSTVTFGTAPVISQVPYAISFNG